MCLTIDHRIHPDNLPLIAEDNIIVYKIIQGFKSLNVNESIHQCFKYKRQQPYAIEMILNGELVKLIRNGFHAFTKCFDASLFYDSEWLASEIESGKMKWVEFCIPKGAKYYMGREGDIVSDQIIAGNLAALRDCPQHIVENVHYEN